MLLIIALAIIAMAIGVSIFRCVIGPGLEDRVLSLDVIAMCILGASAIISVQQGNPLFMEVGFVIAVFSFLSTLAVMYFSEKEEEE